MPVDGCLNLGGPINEFSGEFADCGLFSWAWGGDDPKHSARLILGADVLGKPLPKVNFGNVSGAFGADTGTADAEVVFARPSEGLARDNLLRLYKDQ